MELVQIFLIAVGLAMDACAVSICKGLKMTQKVDLKYTVIIALFFGGFQGIMPLIGWLLGSQFASYVSAVDHWIIFILLALIGGQMIYEALKKDDDDVDDEISYNLKELFMLAIATSIDALGVGVSFAFMENVNIWIAVIIIAVVTFVISFAGVFVGNKFGIKYKSRAELAGGIILVIIGVKILLEHIGLF
ncbi:MAG: manganese efflux pump MntP family protein [Bacteroides sp.]